MVAPVRMAKIRYRLHHPALGLVSGGWMCRSVAVNKAAGAPVAACDFLPVSSSWGIILRVKFPAVRVVFHTAS
ncbi:hypothetical protein D9M72_558570 [compost metagenome]